MTQAQPRFERIPLEFIAPSPTNPRKRFVEAEMAELTESIRTNPLGVVQDIVVRRHPSDGKGFEIVCGERRWRASQRAGKSDIGCKIVQMSDAEVSETQLIENGQRADVHPLEEAQAFVEWLKHPGRDIPSLALKIGKDESFVYKRLKFADLIEPAREAFLKDEINASHALDIARLLPADQQRAMKELFQVIEECDEQQDKRLKFPIVISPSELRVWIQTEVYMDLGKVAFNRSDEKLLPKAGSCLNCTKHTAAQMELLDSGTKGDHCLDAACFHQKQNAHMVQIQKAAKESGRKLLTIAERGGTKADLQKYDTHIITKATDHCDSKEEALWVDGPLVGKTNFICRDKGCKTHKSRGVYGQAAEVKTFADIWKEKRARLDERIKLEAQQEIWRQIIAGVPEEFERADMVTVGKRLIGLAGHDCRRLLCAALKLEPEKKKQYGSTHTDFEGALTGHLEAMEDRLIPGFLVGLTLLSYNSFHEPNLLDVAHSHDIVAAEVKQLIESPLVAEFEKKKAKAKAAYDKKQKAEKAAAKSAAKHPSGKPAKVPKPKKDAKRAAANDVDDDDDPEGEE